ncbi:phosphatidylinositol 4,5-bisphosphate 3-kinase catalytic subunit delta isoform [Halyomorpha halys]|uniref:phosphatidylinositol 4,5-bisphosphate 3-kinase catalytic subunit delta isoform n=1 Tax=Halyomorpha halys TaxID=286706 RepID=UPI0006D4DA82|nr:phosphatidylinositol 4,5-bisphosphate 3-kinase catalytic subunit delta isoform [Halyomorpha halys]XP_014289822.1 phosphatidylinositol 4,5-bisphosphate 3-kinase catalytic subunit delta isoform [Halyomorpha halys]XP_014289823.1 phosphatidylinositol 4,5-bisphosphate 3-kinase catalytic subunit delta isoform [Halyomorpha halys]XP_014289824.1 phosphatidylinositol 4,5-bisphosphate 3-kinase catalytic subunit delta isoform [Halyomorpha halys]XP_014289825.1 phosphatidylinositol 4,5-bisphosphate 3-kina
MVHTPHNYGHDFWLNAWASNQTVSISFFMPNGILIPFEVSKNATLQEIKEDLWEEAAKFPLHWTLHDASAYVFSCINSMAETEELVDEGKRLCDIKPFVGVLKVVERRGDKAEKQLNVQISHLIGRRLHEFDSLKNPEVNYFRWRMRGLGEEVSRCRSNKGWLERLCVQFPPRIDPRLSHSVTGKLKDGNIFIYVKYQNFDSTFKFNVPHSMSPTELMCEVLKKKALKHQSRGDHIGDFVFKVRGQEEYLVGNVPLVEFVYIQESLMKDVQPTLIVVSVRNVPVDTQTFCDSPDYAEDKRVRSSFSTLTSRKRKLISSWNIDDPFAFQVTAICRLNCDSTRTVEVAIQAGLFHGGKALCEPQKTLEKQVTKEGGVCWEEDLQFDIKVCNIPRMARLCFVVYEISKSARGLRSRKIRDSKQELYINPMGWVNTTVYDFKNQLKTGAMTLYMWTYAEDMQTDDLLHSLGTVVSNTNTENAAALTITFHKYHSEHTVVYPSKEKILEFSKENDVGAPRGPASRSTIEQLKNLTGRDPLHEMHEQERKALWSLRYDVLRLESSLLPKLLDCVEWNDHHEVSEAMALLNKWPLLPPERALELLDYAYADQSVRSYAVKCLSKVSDDDLSLYLLQLVQALKHECYLYCDLVEFLLRRALCNQKIGHFLFWHLRSEMHVASVWVRFGLVLEAYCRSALDGHIGSLSRQVELVTKLKSVSEAVRTRKDKPKLTLQDSLKEEHVMDTVAGVLNPLDPSYRCRNVRIEKCRVMDSKMKPLWVVLENDDVFGDDIYIIFKNGDDLRQDMLTLQMIRIMDRIWKNEGLDLRMNPYGCISTDNRVGLIEVVLNAETIANIQKEKGMFTATSAFRKGSLLAWLKDHNPTEVSLNKAIEEFTYSCAGYCVATYVLGVADRHSDNIMVKKTGQLFHIDFGHILGHFKEKFGFRRERVPFVLTHDFVHVINKGQTKKIPVEFEVFQKRCEQAFLILRRHGSLILSLFAMMISTGLPELSSENDLNYLRETLVLDLCEADASAHFMSKFDEALSNSWKTSLNWASHNLAKNNKQ